MNKLNFKIHKIKLLIICILIPFLLIIIQGNVFANKDLYEKGLDALQRGDIEEAKAIFKKIFTETPNDYYAPYSMYQYARLIEKIDDVLYYLKLITEKYPNFNDLDIVYNDIGTIYFLTEKYEESKANFYKLYKNFPKSPLSIRGMYYVGKCLFKQGSIEKALDWFDALYRSFPKNYYASLSLFEIGFIYEGKNDYDKALVYYNKMLEEYPESDAISKALYRKVLIYLGVKKDIDKGFELMAVILLNYPESFEADFVRKILSDNNISEKDFLKQYKEYSFVTSNKKIINSNKENEDYTPTKKESKAYFIQLGAFSLKESAENYIDRLLKDGFNPCVVTKKDLFPSSNDSLYLVIIGFFSTKEEANDTIKKLKSKGYDCFISKREDM